MALPDLTDLKVNDTFQRLLQISSSNIVLDGTGSNVGMTNLVSNAGVVATDVTAVGTARQLLSACSFN